MFIFKLKQPSTTIFLSSPHPLSLLGQCWILYVDVVVLECGGNLMDSVSIAVKAALFDTKIPRVRVRVDEETEVKDVELSDDPHDCISLDIVNVPLVVTTSKIGYGHVVDATRWSYADVYGVSLVESWSRYLRISYCIAIGAMAL